MNQTQAINKLRKVLGANFGYRIDKRALDAEGREAAKAKRKEVFVTKQVAKAAMDARHAELLQDPKYAELRAEYLRLNKEDEALLAASFRTRIDVGVSVMGVAFHIHASGDNWDEVVAKVVQ